MKTGVSYRCTGVLLVLLAVLLLQALDVFLAARRSRLPPASDGGAAAPADGPRAFSTRRGAGGGAFDKNIGARDSSSSSGSSYSSSTSAAAIGAAALAAIDRSPNAEWVRGLPACTAMRAAHWGLGSQLVTFVDISTILRLHGYGGELYLDFRSSTYQCGQPGFFSFKAFLRGGDEALPGAFSEACRSPYPWHWITTWKTFKVLDLSEGPIRSEARYLAAELDITKEQLETGQGLSAGQAVQRTALVLPYMEQQCWAARQLWRWSDGMAKVVDDALAPLGVSSSPSGSSSSARQRDVRKPLVAVHNRRGDKVREYPEEYRLAYNMTQAVQRLAGRHPGAVGGTCVVVGDDGGVLDEIIGALTKYLKCKVVNRVEKGHAHVQEGFYRLGADARCLETQRYLVDVALLAAADYSIGSIQSNVDALASIVGRCVHGRAPDTYLDVAGWPVDRLLWTTDR